MIENCIQRFVSCHTFLLIIMLLTLRKAHSSSQLENAPVCNTTDCEKSAKFIMENLDPTVEPCEDFYQFACGNWKKRHPVPEYLEDYNVFTTVTLDVNMKLKKDIEKPINPNDPHLIQYGKKMYATCISENLQERYGLSEFLKWFNRFGGWPMANDTWDSSLFNREEAHIEISRESVNQAPFLQVNVIPDFTKDSSQPIISISLAKLPISTSFYLYPEEYPTSVKSYVGLMTSMVRILSNKTRELSFIDKDSIFILETAIAQIMNDTKYTSVLDKSVYRMTISELNILTNGKFNWLRYLQGLFKDIKEIKDDEPVLLGDPPINFIRLFYYLEKLSDRSMSNYLMWRYALNYAISINSQTKHAFYNFLDGNINRPEFPRWMFCMSMMQKYYYPVMSYLYIKDYFGREIEENAKKMFETERISLKNLFKDTYWMDNYTLTIVNEKIDEMILLIGYPEWLQDPTAVENHYKEMPNSTEYLIDNVRNIFMHTISLTLQEINSPVNRKWWYNHPEDVIPTYDRNLNSLHIPAASLQFPFFSTNGLKALNFGAVGMHFGHEMMHGFDVLGFQLDKYGNMTHWTRYAEQGYFTSAFCLRRQYSKYCFPDLQLLMELPNPLCVNGALTLNENIADNAGIKVAFNAYQSWVKDNGEESRLPGLTQFSPQQLFFLSFAQSFCGVETNYGLFKSLFKDRHAPDKYRILGTLTNSDDFANVFQCPTGSQMNPLSLKCTFW